MKSIVSGALAAMLLSSGPAHAAALAVERPPVVPAAPAVIDGVTQTTLANGLRLVIVRNHLAPVATVSMTYGVGGDDDTIPGIAHATEHMMFRGTADVTSDQFANIATRTGAQYNAETTNQYTRYYFTVPSAYLGVVLKLESSRMNGASLRAEDWATERGAIEQEVKAHQGNPLFKVAQRISKVFYGDTPYAQDALGTVPGFERMTAKDIAAFYRAWYHPNNATLVIAGDVDPAVAVAEAQTDFDSIPSANLPAHRPIALAPLPNSTVSDTIDFPVPIAGVTFRLPGLASPDYAASNVLVSVLSNARSSVSDLTLSGKTLGAFAYGSALPEVGFGSVLAISHPGEDPNVTLKEIRAALQGYQDGGVPAELVEAAKTRLLADRSYDAASIPGQAFGWATALAEGAHSPAEVTGDFTKVTAADVDRVLHEYLDPAHEIAVVINAKPGSSIARTDENAAKERVQVKASADVPLPSWTSAYFDAPLQAPRVDDVARTFHLQNGMTVSTRRETFSPTVTLKGEIRTSPQLYEPHGKDGVASVTDGLMAWGTKTYDLKAYQAQLDAIAANVDVGTSFSMTVRAQDFDRAVELLADGQLHPAFLPANFSIVQRNALQATLAMEHRPETQAYIAQLHALYPAGDPRRRRADGRTLAAITLDDVKRWYRFAYRPDLTTMSVVGDVSPDHVRDVVKKYFGDWRAVGRKPDFRYPALRTDSKTSSVTVRSATNKQADVTLTQVLGVHRYDRDVIALELANTVLSGEGTGSLLFRTVRTAKGYVYSIDSSVDVGKTGSTFSIEFSSDAKNVGHAQATAIAQIESMRTKAIASSDLQRAKAVLLAERIVNLDTYDGVAYDLLSSAQNGVDANDTYRYYTLMLETTPQQVREAMHRWIDPKRFSRVLVAPGT